MKNLLVFFLFILLFLGIIILVVWIQKRLTYEIEPAPGQHWVYYWQGSSDPFNHTDEVLVLDTACGWVWCQDMESEYHKPSFELYEFHRILNPSRSNCK